MYSFNTRLRYSELDNNLNLPLSSLVDLFQDCSTFHSESIGKGIDYLTNHNRVWLISGWQIELFASPERFDNVVVSTWPHKFDALFGYRNFTLADNSGNILAAANSIWTLVNTKTLHPEKITVEDTDGYDVEEPFYMEYLPRKIKYDKEGFTDMTPIPVVKAHLDSNQHVNNAQYLSMADDILPSDFNYTRVRGEYKMAAHPGDIIYPKLQVNNNICTVLLCNNDGKIYTVIQFS